MRQAFVAGNWKMNGTRASVRALMDGIRAGLSGDEQAEIAVCPPFVFLQSVAEMAAGSAVKIGGQNLATAGSGAYTGEIAGAMLREFGCEFVIVGHSERRAYYGESNELVAEKFAKAQAVGLTPIFCVGEQLDDREADRTQAVVAAQLDAVLSAVGVAPFAHAVVAYEPVWAIGTGKTATPEQAQAVHAFIRARIAAADAAVADGLRILYGGSVNAGNAQLLFGMPDIDGGLIGGAALKPADFLAICQAAG